MKKLLVAAFAIAMAGSMMAQEPITWSEVVITPASLDSIKNADQLSSEEYLAALENMLTMVDNNLDNIKGGLDEAKDRKKSV